MALLQLLAKQCMPLQMDTRCAHSARVHGRGPGVCAPPECWRWSRPTPAGQKRGSPATATDSEQPPARLNALCETVRVVLWPWGVLLVI